MVLTTVVGSYPRVGDTPADQGLRRAIGRLDRGEITEEELRSVERETVKAILREQNDAGIDLVTDGQISWYDSQSHIAGKLSSVEINGLVRYFDTNTYYRQPVVRGPVVRKAPLLVDEWKFAQANSKAPVKAVLTGPVTLASLSQDKHYQTRKALAIDLATALGQEVEALVAAGASHVQIDEQGSTKPLVLGLIDARNTKEEDPTAIAKKVSELRSSVDLKASYLAPSNGLEFLPRDRARKKLRILRAAADAVGVAG